MVVVGWLLRTRRGLESADAREEAGGRWAEAKVVLVQDGDPLSAYAFFLYNLDLLICRVHWILEATHKQTSAGDSFSFSLSLFLWLHDARSSSVACVCGAGMTEQVM